MLLSKTEFLILSIMSKNGFRELYGLEMLELSDGKIKRGTIYTTLQRMQDKEFVTSYKEDKPDNVPGNPRRLYKITGKGKLALNSYQELQNFGLDPVLITG